MANQVITKNAGPSFIERFDVVSNKDQSKDVSLLGKGSTINLQYFESVMYDTIKATYTYADSGNTIDNKTALNGLPIVGQEKVNLKFKDNNENTLDIVMYVNKVTPLLDDTTKSAVTLELVSKEFIMNEKVRLNTRFDGKISDHIRKILTDKNYLATEKDIDIEETSNNYNFIGNNRKPYYALNWLSKKAIPSTQGADGNTAGYFFYETSEGFKFKSIETLLGQEKKKSIIYNQTPDSSGENIPAGYDAKALEYSKDNNIDVQEKLKMGTYSTRTVLFDPFTCYYEVVVENAKDKESSLTLAGKELPTLNPEFNREGSNKDFSRTTYMLLDKGTLPTGNTTQQVEKSKEQNFDPKKILNQAIRRYNQLFSVMTTITIPGDFSLHAGDAIFIDAPPKDSEKSDQVDTENGGLYIIADLCHLITPKETYTKLNLVRDSFGRSGNHTSGNIPL
jgi:hypothetical protein